MRSVSASLAVLLLLLTAGCTRAVQVPPAALEAAQLGVRVKTALVNDADVGARIIEVRVDRGVVTLSGLVASEAERERAVTLVRRVPGVTDVVSQLVVGEEADIPPQAERPSSPEPSVMSRAIESSATERRLLAIGASLFTPQPVDASFSSGVSLQPMVRLGVGRGLGLTMGFSWFDADLAAAPRSAAPATLGRIRVRPVMAGASYSLTDQQHWSFSLSMMAGLAFNSFTVNDAMARDGLALAIDNSFAMRPGASLWYDINSRVAVNVFSGYLFTRPRMTFLEDGQFTRRSVRADTAVYSVGLAYKVF